MNKDDLRPTRLDDYIGQNHIKEPLNAALESALARDAPLPHVLLSGPPGLGKTTLSMILAWEMNWPMVDIIGSTAGTPKELSQRILFLREPSLLFIDEIHALRRPVQEVLYPVLEDGRLLYKSMSGSRSVDIQPLTIVGATTHLGLLAQPFIDRFLLQFQLVFYKVEELMELGHSSATKLGLTISEDGMEALAKRSRGTPRYTNNYLKWLRDFAIYQEKSKTMDADYVKHILWDKLKVDSLGLTPLDRSYLRHLAEYTSPVGLEPLAARMRQQEVTLENTVEPFLLYARLIERVRNGRQITELGRYHIKHLRSRK